ncbi:hypothetical protein [Streptomyces sp. CT34]|uniref:hypothetical protein n=1 Tax=Streptomyces sp. CT34 TaxID=1553907 RepID=UPI0005BE3A8A|nr:hypothetical protein [Streptomyces sp. CT34]
MAAVLVAGDFDGGGVGEAVADLSPLWSGQGAVVGMGQDVDAEDGASIALATGGEGVFPQRVVEGVCPANGPAGTLAFVVDGELSPRSRTAVDGARMP